MTKIFKIVILVFAILASVGLSYFFLAKKQDRVSLVPVDGYVEIQSSNSSFAEGAEAAMRGDYEAALALFEKSKKESATEREKGIIDFNIADTRFKIDRISGIEDFITLSKNENYERRTRALAMVRAYLMYLKYNDQTILIKLANEYGIPWTTGGEVINTYMKQVYELYPFAYPAISMLRHDLFSVKTKEEALALYSPFAPQINEDIEKMKQNIGEATEVTSTMLLRAKLFSSLHLRFNAVSKEEVEKSFEDLINYSQTKNLRVNIQYALLTYADFEGGAKDYQKAVQVLNILLSGPLDSAVTEALSKTATSTYPYLLSVSENTESKDIKEFIAGIGSAANRK